MKNQKQIKSLTPVPIMIALLGTAFISLSGCETWHKDEVKKQCDHIETRDLPHCAGGHQPELPPQ